MEDVTFAGQREGSTHPTNSFAYFWNVSSLNDSASEFQELKLNRVLLDF
jgi:hypothetical protein